jgi:hypothetical protein
LSYFFKNNELFEQWSPCAKKKEKTLFLEKQGLKMKVVEDKRSCPKERT